MAKDDTKDPVKAREKATKKAAKVAKKAARKERFAQLRLAFSMTRKADSRLIPILALTFVVPFVLLLGLGLVIGGIWIFSLGFFGAMLGVLATLAMFGRRVQRHQYTQVEGQVGAAAAVIEAMRGDWRVSPAVGFTREQDLVHRIVGRPGVVLVAEGSPARTGRLIATEKKRLARFVGDTPVYDVHVGDAAGQVAISKLEKHFAKLPRNIKPKDVNILDRKLKAMAPQMPIPKGPVPGVTGQMKRPRQR